MDNHTKNKIGVTLGIIAFMGIGIWAIVDPAAADTWTPTGRKAWLMRIIINIWGRPFGIALIVMNILALFGLYCTPAGEDLDDM